MNNQGNPPQNEKLMNGPRSDEPFGKIDTAISILPPAKTGNPRHDHLTEQYKLYHYILILQLVLSLLSCINSLLDVMQLAHVLHVLLCLTQAVLCILAIQAKNALNPSLQARVVEYLYYYLIGVGIYFIWLVFETLVYGGFRALINLFLRILVYFIINAVIPAWCWLQAQKLKGEVAQ
jgi:hypothetical protein